MSHFLMTMVHIGVVHVMKIWFGIKSFAQIVANLFCGKVGEVGMTNEEKEIVNILRQVETEELVHVVRCKDCKWMIDGTCKMFRKWYDPDFFCADGVSKDINVPDKEGR